jgi:hypothetical protein
VHVLWRADGDFAVCHALADVVVSFADEGEVETIAEEGSEGLTCRATEGEVDRVGLKSVVLVDLGDTTGGAGADVPVGVNDIVGSLERATIHESGNGVFAIGSTGVSGDVFEDFDV